MAENHRNHLIQLGVVAPERVEACDHFEGLALAVNDLLAREARSECPHETDLVLDSVLCLLIRQVDDVDDCAEVIPSIWYFKRFWLI